MRQIMNRYWLYLVIGCAGLTAQTGQALRVLPPDMDERTLQEKYHIASTKEGLIGALRHQSSEVRSFAASKLADDGDKNAITPILDALAAETLEGNKIVLAASAARLGASEGFDALEGMCDDGSWSPTTRMVAAQTMVQVVRRRGCLSGILDVLGSAPDDHQAAQMGLNLLPSFKQAPPGQLAQMRDLSAGYLKSEAPQLRIVAGQCVRDLGGPWAISQLRTALDAERNQTVRNSLAKDLVSVRQ